MPSKQDPRCQPSESIACSVRGIAICSPLSAPLDPDGLTVKMSPIVASLVFPEHMMSPERNATSTCQPFERFCAHLFWGSGRSPVISTPTPDIWPPCVVYKMMGLATVTLLLPCVHCQPRSG